MASFQEFQVCRACLSSCSEFCDLKRDSRIVKAFWDLAKVRIELMDDNMPQTVCKQCLQKFIEFDEFRRAIINADEILIKSSGKDYTKPVNIANSQITGNQEQGEKIEYQPEPVKEEFVLKEELKELPSAEVFETHFDDSSIDDASKKSELAKEILKSKMKSKKQRHKEKEKSRKYVEIDPEKITIIELSRSEQVTRHKEEALKPSYLDMPHKCDLCFKGYNFERKLVTHIENYHKMDSKYKCDICSRTMINSASFALHLRKHKLLYQCNVCLLGFVEKSRAIGHFKSFHEGIEPIIPCQHCDRVFRNRSTLNGHIRNYHPNTSRPQCRECHKTFATTDSLQDHMLIHTGEKNYACPLCDKRFRLKQSVAVHMRSHSASRSFYCIECDVSFKSKAALVYHTKTTTKHVPTDLRNENACSECARTFTTAYRLRVHSKTHSETRLALKRVRSAPQLRFICHHCGHRFMARRSLERHLKSQHTAYACPPHRQKNRKLQQLNNKDLIIK